MSLRTQLYRSVFALPLLMVGLLALQQSPEAPAPIEAPLASNTQLLLPMIMGPGLCQQRLAPALPAAGARSQPTPSTGSRCRA